MEKLTKNIALFASGSGTNALNICEYFKNSDTVKVNTLVCNKPRAKVIERLEAFNIKLILISKADFKHPKKLIGKLQAAQIDLIVLAGFLWLIPVDLIKAFENKIINLHPALLPKYGGKGMFGINVHNAILKAKEKVTGITIHFVNEAYDEGEIIFQASINIDETETAESIAQKIHQLEYAHFPKVIESVLMS